MTTPMVQEVRNTEDFDGIVVQAQAILGQLKPLDYNALYIELIELNVRTSENPTLQQMNVDLQSVQGAKDRVSEISVDVMRHAQTYRRVADLLTEGWIKFSDQSGADKRKGEAALKMSQFEHMAVEAETLHKATLGVLKNLDSKHEASSRQITCFSLMLKLRDVGRTTGDSSFMPEDFTNYQKIDKTPASVVVAMPAPQIASILPLEPAILDSATPAIGTIPQFTHASPPVQTIQLPPPLQTTIGESTTLQSDVTASTVSPTKSPDEWDAFSRG